MALTSIQPLKRNEYQMCFLRGKSGRCLRLTNLPPSCADSPEILGSCAEQDQAGPNWTANFLTTQCAHAPRHLSLPPPFPSLPFLLPVVQRSRYSVPGCGAVIINISSWLSTSKFCPELRPGPVSLVGPRGPKWSFELGLAPRGQQGTFGCSVYGSYM
jgi:hypothetical protein